MGYRGRTFTMFKFRSMKAHSAEDARAVAKKVDPAGVLEELLDVGLADAKVTVNVAPVVCFLVIAHVLTPC